MLGERRRMRAIHRDRQPGFHPVQPRRFGQADAAAEKACRYRHAGWSVSRRRCRASRPAGCSGNYEIDLFQTIIKRIESAAKELGDGCPYGKNEESDISFRAIADHARTMSFLIADGVTPGNTDREYVMRRIIRRAARHGRYLGIHRPFLAQAHEGVIDAMGDAYPEIKRGEAKIAEVVTQEESRFGETLDRGLELIDTELAKHREERRAHAARRRRIQTLRYLRISRSI